MTQVVLNGNAYSDDGSSSRDMRSGGFRQWLLLMLGDAMIEAGQAANGASDDAEAAGVSEQAAAQSARAAEQALQQVLNTGSGWSPVLQIAVDGTRYVLQVLDWTGGLGPKPAVGYLAATGVVPEIADGLNIRGAVAYSDLTGKPTLGTAAALDVPAAAGEAASAAQVVRGDDPRLTANTGSLPRSARTSMTMLGESDLGTWVDITSGTFIQTFAAAATLGSGWWCYLRNSGQGAITLQAPAGSSIDDLASYVMYPSECRLLQCDGSVLRSIVITPMHLNKRASFDFIKPPGYWAFELDVRGASGGGGSGGAGGYANGGYRGSGGGGSSGCVGSRWTARFPEWMLQALTSFDIGAAGIGGPGVESAPAIGPSVVVSGVNGSAGGATVVTIDGVTFSASGGAGGRAGGGSSGSVAGSGGTAVNSTGSTLSGKYTSAQAANRYRYLSGSQFGASNPGVSGAFINGGGLILGGAGGPAMSDSLASGISGAGGMGGPARSADTGSVSQPGLDGEPGMVIIEGVL